MDDLTGRVMLDAATGRSPWSGLTASGPAVTADLATALDALADLDRRSQTRRYAGYLGYDLGRCFETLPAAAPDDLGLPLLACVAQTEPTAQVPARPAPLAAVGSFGRFHNSTFTRPAYETAVRRALDYVAAGDVFQVNLSQRLAVETQADASQIYRRLIARFPAEYAGFFDFGRFQILSNSPELFLRVTRLPDGRRRIVNRPIKGTRPNAPGMHADLLASEKDKAELAMIVDLQRNDLGRICETGSVVVTEPRTIETHPTVLHGVATIEGILREPASLADVLRATFPCGSVTGCPKIRAMQIIDELEPVRRGVYCGAIGWVGGGEMELAVAIRTMTILNGVAYVPVGGGVVADSQPAAEYDETLVKARAMLSALGVARTIVE